MDRLNKNADEAERLYVESGLPDEPLIEAESRQLQQADAGADPPLIVDKTEYERPLQPGKASAGVFLESAQEWNFSPVAEPSGLLAEKSLQQEKRKAVMGGRGGGYRGVSRTFCIGVIRFSTLALFNHETPASHRT